VVVTVLAAALAGGTLSSEGFVDPDAESQRAAAVVEEEFGRGESGLVLVVEATAGSVTDPAVAAAGTELAERLAAEPGVSQVVSFWATGAPGLRSEDGRHALVTAELDLPPAEAEPRAAELAEEYRGDAGPVTVSATGPLVVSEEIGSRIGSDLVRAELVALPVAAVLLILYLRRVRVALVPLVVVGIVVAGAVSVLGLLAGATTVSVFATNLVVGLGLGLTVDYSLLVVARYREELARTPDRRAAMVTTLRTAGRTVAISGATVALALAALLVYPFDFLRSMALAGMVAALLAVVLPLLMLPWPLLALGERVGPRASCRDLAGARSAVAGRFWSRVAGAAMHRPLPVALGVLAVLAVAATPLLGLRLDLGDDRVLPADSPARQAAEVLRADFAGAETSPLTVVLSPSGDGPPDAEAVAGYAAALSELPGVARVDTAQGSVVGGATAAPPGPQSAALVAGDRQLLLVVPSVEPTGEAAQDLVRDVRDLPVPGEVLVGGQTAVLVDTVAGLADATPWAAAVLVTLSLSALVLLLGTVIVPVVSLLLTLLSLGAALGVMVLVFQEGFGAGLLGVTATGAVTAAFPVLVFCVGLGLAMDYAVFMLSRIRELRLAGTPTREAVRLGVGRTGGVVAVAAVLMAVVFGAIATASVANVVMLGAILLVAVLVDALVVRPLLMPAVLALLGDRAWWAPRSLTRLQTRLGLHEH
jgi:RND superfamily putative drug exporter